MHLPLPTDPPPRHLRIVADDLSGAAECAAALARACRHAAPLVLAGEPPGHGSWCADTDSRALDSAAAGRRVAQALRRAAGSEAAAAVPFKKIDSPCAPRRREPAAACQPLCSRVVAPPPAQAARSGGVSSAGHARPRRQPLDLVQLLPPRLLLLVRARPGQGPAELAGELGAAVASGARLLVADAADEGDLRRLARALVLAGRQRRLLGVGAAGLAGALAAELLPDDGAAARGANSADPVERGPMLAVVGSFNPVSTRQVEELAREPDVHLLRLDAVTWTERPQALAAHIAQADSLAAAGRSIVLAVTGGSPVNSSRRLAERMARAAAPLVRRAASLVLTGGDTARAVLDHLGVHRLQVHGEIEPGICLSRAGSGGPAIVTKAGGFGDGGSLVRVLRHLRATPPTETALERKQ